MDEHSWSSKRKNNCFTGIGTIQRHFFIDLRKHIYSVPNLQMRKHVVLKVISLNLYQKKLVQKTPLLVSKKSPIMNHYKIRDIKMKILTSLML